MLGAFVWDAGCGAVVAAPLGRTPKVNITPRVETVCADCGERPPQGTRSVCRQCRTEREREKYRQEGRDEILRALTDPNFAVAHMQFVTGTKVGAVHRTVWQYWLGRFGPDCNAIHGPLTFHAEIPEDRTRCRLCFRHRNV